MSHIVLTYIHLLTVLPAALIGLYLMFTKKGSAIHKNLGKLYMILIFITAAITLFMKAEVGPLFLDHFGYLHLLSILALISVPWAYFAIRRQNVMTHQIIMISLFIGGILIAGGFAFMPGRLLNQWVFG